MFDGENIKVLMVDDEPEILTLLARIATAMGFDVIRASSISEALEEIENADTMITDLKLNGDMTGGEIILDAWLSRRSGPVCILTGFADRAREVDLITRGADNVIAKPAAPAALQSILNRYGRRVKDARERGSLKLEIEALKVEVAELKKQIIAAQKKATKLTMTLGLLLVLSLGVDLPSGALSDIASKLFALLF